MGYTGVAGRHWGICEQAEHSESYHGGCRQVHLPGSQQHGDYIQRCLPHCHTL